MIEKSGVKFRLSRKESLSERTLYHGTIADYEGSIRQYGLQGGWHGPLGSFVSQHYDSQEYGEPTEDDEDDEVVFATHKQELGKAVNAMVHHISQKLKKEFHDVTDNDIRNYGLLVIIKDGSDAPRSILMMTGVGRMRIHREGQRKVIILHLLWVVTYICVDRV